ncbi:hypothetical protein Nepgr_030038 [Nepenthes gracilis]|uniref:Uncharacterized protein n=1 Tax=Nepenthes gracilis TaxID=150966 RepID=A0AAD3TEM6_NEPGR|nr:hypothetical protein Nepgr_030038 [Nepenthes gracilis]
MNQQLHRESRRHQRHHFANWIKVPSVGLFSSTLRLSSTAVVEKNSIEPPQQMQNHRWNLGQHLQHQQVEETPSIHKLIVAPISSISARKQPADCISRGRTLVFGTSAGGDDKHPSELP